MSAKRLEILREAVPSLSRAALLWRPGAVHHPQLVHETEQAAQRLGVVIVKVEATGANDIANAFQAAVHAGARAMLVVQASEFFRINQEIAALGLKHRLPTMTAEDGFAEAGGLMKYGASPTELVLVRQ